MPEYKCRWTVKANGKVHEEGSVITLSAERAKSLLQCGAVSAVAAKKTGGAKPKGAKKKPAGSASGQGSGSQVS